MTATATPVRCTLADIADHLFVTVEARIESVVVTHKGIPGEWATLTLTDSGARVDARVYSATWRDFAHLCTVGARIEVTGVSAQDTDGLFMAAHTIHPIGDPR